MDFREEIDVFHTQVICCVLASILFLLTFALLTERLIW